MREIRAAIAAIVAPTLSLSVLSAGDFAIQVLIGWLMPAVFMLKAAKEKRLRCFMLLPLVPGRIVLARLLLLVSVPIFVSLAFTLIRYSSGGLSGGTMFGVASLNGCIVSLIIILVVGNDLRSYASPGARLIRTALILIFVLFFLAIGVVTLFGLSEVESWIIQFVMSLLGAVILNLVALSLFWIAIKVFARRPSFLPNVGNSQLESKNVAHFLDRNRLL